MPGFIAFTPIEAKFATDKDPEAKIDPYCKFKIGWHSGKTNVSTLKEESLQAKWADVVTLERNHDESFAKLKVKDKTALGFDGVIGQPKIDLELVMANKKIAQWYTIYNKDKPTGEVFMSVEYVPPM